MGEGRLDFAPIRAQTMPIVRRWMTAACCIAGSAAAAVTLAQPAPGAGVKSASYPTRPIRLIIPFPPAGTADTLARGLGQKLGELYGQALVMDNRAGAGGNLGTELAAKSKPACSARLALRTRSAGPCSSVISL